MAQKTVKFSGRSTKQKDVRNSNIVAAKAIADMIRTSLGPKGMDKMITSSSNEVVITNDGATILDKMEVLHPAAKMLVDLSKAQDVEAGDGTTSVVIIAGALLTSARDLLNKGIHPAIISEAWLIAQQKCHEFLRKMAIPVDLTQKGPMIEAAITSLSSKVVSTHSAKIAPIAVEAVLRVIDPATAINVNLDEIKVIKKLGGTIEETKLIDGLIFEKSASHSAGGPTSMKNAKIGLIQFCLSAPKTNMENSVIIDDYQQIDRIFKEERRYIIGLLKPIIKSGCNVLLIQKSILRDAVNDLSLHYLAKKKIMVIRDIERSEIEFISTTLGCTPITDKDGFTADKLGFAETVEETWTPGGSIVKVLGVKNPGKTVTILVRGSNRLVIDEAERSVHDALCVIRCLIKERFLIPGGGAPEIELSMKLGKYAESLGGMNGYCIKEFAKALEVIPYTLAENAGLHPITILTELRKHHNKGRAFAGINVRKGGVTDIRDENVLQPMLVTLSAIKLATETVRTILKIDDIVAVR